MHPKATIFAIAGPIVIGMGCIIEEGAIIVNRYETYHASSSTEGFKNIMRLVLLCLGGKKSCVSGTRTSLKSDVVSGKREVPSLCSNNTFQVRNAQA